MIDILQVIANKLAADLLLETGVNIFCYELPDALNATIVVQEPKHIGEVFQQIDAETHFIEITARSKGNVAAKELATKCYNCMCNDTGILEQDGVTFSVELQGTPIWKKSDQQDRKYFYFTMKVITMRLNKEA